MGNFGRRYIRGRIVELSDFHAFFLVNTPAVFRSLIYDSPMDCETEKERIGPAMVSEPSLAKDWLKKEEVEAWRDL